MDYKEEIRKQIMSHIKMHGVWDSPDECPISLEVDVQALIETIISYYIDYVDKHRPHSWACSSNDCVCVGREMVEDMRKWGEEFLAKDKPEEGK